MRHRERQKSCDRCQQVQATLYRVQWIKSQMWQFVCSDCWSSLRHHDNYRYGGTWKSKKRS
ncbi:MAG: hypothetical protein EA367_14100 [Leptolyngbya sp. DLM2.Bin15]|nr:MAG: hypothetical protein EA367_14100 [Leptolyngbya sp. DLM2.Bin15]